MSRPDPPNDRVPSAAPERSDPPRWLVPAAGLLVTLITCRTLFIRMGNLAPGDWDYFVTLHDAVRKSILEYHQFPWWNPWMAGGMPLAANPQVMLFSITTPLILLFGTLVGLKLTLAIHFLVGFEGARRVAGRFVKNPFFQLVAAAVFTWNSGQTTGAAVGQFGNMTIFFVPWLIYFALGIGGSWRNAVGLGVTEGLMLLTNMHYNAVYGLLFAHLLIAITLWSDRPRRRAIIVNLAISGLLGLALAGFRVWGSWQYFADYPRENALFMHVGPRLLLRALFEPWQSPATHPITMAVQVGLPPNARLVDMRLAWWEVACYVGVLPILLFFLSLRPRIRWWHVFALICLAFGYSAVAPWSPGTWLSQLPVFRSMWVITRWRFPAMLFVGLAAAACLDSWSQSPRRCLRRVAWACGTVILLDLLASTVPGWDSTFFMARRDFKNPNPPARYIRSYRTAALDTDAEMLRRLRPYVISSFMSWYEKQNLAVIDAYETVLGYGFRRPTRRLWVGNPAYRGEWTVDGKETVPELWSPLHVRIRARAGQRVWLNQNPGRYWIVNGRRPWPRKRVFELTEDWVVTQDEDGVCDIRIRPPELAGGLMLSGAAAVLFALLLGFRRRLSGDPPPAAPA